MKQFLFSFLLLFCLGFVSIAQESILHGKVSDFETGETLPGVNILLEDSSGMVSNEEGNFSKRISVGEHTLRISYVGYSAQTKKITVTSKDSTALSIRLRSSASELGTIVVSASRYEQKIEEAMVSMEVIKPSTIENSGANTLENVLDKVPSVSLFDGSVSIRGGSGFSYGAGSRVLLLVDDLPMMAADAGDIKWTALATENIAQVEIIKGASSALFGSSALNGVINLRTAFPSDSAEGKMSFMHGIYDNPKRKELKWWKNSNPFYSGMQASYRKKIKQLDVVTGLNLFTDEGYRMGEKEQRIRGNANLRYRFKKIEGLSAGVNLGYTNTQGGNFLIWQNDSSGAYIPSGGIDTPTTTLSNYVTSRVNVDPYLTYTRKKSNHKVRTRFFRSNNKNDSDQESLADFYFGEYSFSSYLRPTLLFSSGIGMSASLVKSGLYGDHEGRNYFGFLQLEKKFFERWSISLGIRGEYFKVDSSETKNDVLLFPGIIQDSLTLIKNSNVKPVLRLASNYRLFKATHVRASYGEGYRFPSIAEKYIRTNAGAFNIYPNDSVQAETGWSAEFGIRQGLVLGRFRGYFDLAAFYSEYSDMMEFSFGVWDTNPAPGTLGIGFKSRNVSKAIIQGIDFSMGMEGKVGAFGFELSGGYTYMDPTFGNFNPAHDTLHGTANYNVLKYRYKHLAKADLDLFWKKISLGGSMRYNSFMESIDRAFSEFIPGVKHYRLTQAKEDFIFDARASYSINKDLKVSFLVLNVANREQMIRPADMQPPRIFSIRAEMKF